MDILVERLQKAYNPFEIMKAWCQDIHKLNLIEPTAMTLTTCNQKGVPSSRIVLLKDISESGFTFYTNYQSLKACDIQENPYVAILIYFDQIQRQIRIQGQAKKVSAKKSDEYFASRPYQSQIGAWASQQSQEITHRDQLSKQIKYFQNKYPHSVPRPPHWGGFLVRPFYFEFWIAGEYRLHHRFVFELKQDENIWQKKILSP